MRNAILMTEVLGGTDYGSDGKPRRQPREYLIMSGYHGRLYIDMNAWEALQPSKQSTRH
jgi:hypothetical protein